MSDYSKSTNFTAKDGLSTGDPNKRINGSLFDGEFDPIATAVASKIDKVAGETGELAIFTAAGGLESSDILPSVFDTFALEATSILAGNGITGGGDLSASRTLTLGTPTEVNSSSTDSVTTTSHTHSLDISGEFTASQSLSTNGYQDLPGGLILQWMTSVESTDINDVKSFPKPFPNAVLAVSITPQGISASQTGGGIVTALTTSGLAFKHGQDYNNGQTGFVFAIGY